MGVLVDRDGMSVATAPNKSFQGTPKKLHFFSAPELKRYRAKISLAR